MRNAILTLVSLVALGAPALAQDSTDGSGATTTTESTNTSTTAPAPVKTTTTTTRKPAPVAVHKTTTTRHTSKSGISIKPVSVNRNTVITPNGASSTTTVSH